jgi:signal peptidase I
MTHLGQFESPQSPKPKRKGRRWRRFRKNIFVSFFIDLIVIAGTALILSLLIKSFLIRTFFIPSGSMLETLQIDDRIIVNKLIPDLSPIQHGDVVVFKDPGGWLGDYEAPALDPITATTDWILSAFGITAPDSDQYLVKRVIGVGGDRVICCDADGKITINGTAITETYLQPGKEPSSVDFDVTVPENSYWMLGDNRDNSADSRFHMELPSKGFVSKEIVDGKAFAITWPFSNAKWLDNYPDVFKNVPKP